MVRLKGSNPASVPPGRPQFQFHDGSIKGMLGGYFIGLYRLFQFHDGSIKGHQVKICQDLCCAFQFHDGSIKGALVDGYTIHHLSFNSTMVRLKEQGPPHRQHMTLFQFHDGSIKGKQGIILKKSIGFQFHDGSIKGNLQHYTPIPIYRFNSTMVRLKEDR